MMPIFGTHLRHFGHMTHMLDSDWSKKILLRSDWLGPSVAPFTTHAHDLRRLRLPIQ